MHLVAAERALADPAAARAGERSGARAAGRRVTDDEVAGRRERLRAALAGFDAATIVTTHQFCQYVLTGLGIAGDGDADVELVESLDDLVVEVVDDLYVRAFAGSAAADPIFDRDTALTLARKVINDPQARLVPPARTGRQRGGLAGAVRRGGPRRGRPAQAAAPDPRLRRPARAGWPPRWSRRTRRPGTGCAPAGRPCWSTSSRTPTRCNGRSCERAFAGHATMVLVGDPKQSIYAFRGGDIDTYLAAARTAGTHERP